MKDLEALKVVADLARKYDDNMLRALFKEYRLKYGRDMLIVKLEKIFVAESFVRSSPLIDSELSNQPQEG